MQAAPLYLCVLGAGKLPWLGGTGQLLSLLTPARQRSAEHYNDTHVPCSQPRHAGWADIASSCVVQIWVTRQSLSLDFHDNLRREPSGKIESKASMLSLKERKCLYSCGTVPSVVTEGTFFLWLGLKTVLIPYKRSQFQERPLLWPAAEAAAAVHFMPSKRLCEA